MRGLHLIIGIAAVSCGLSGCSDKKKAQEAEHQAREARRAAAAAKALAAPPKERLFTTSAGDVLMLDLPIATDRWSDRVEVQRCFVFTSKATGQSNMTCPQPPANEEIELGADEEAEYRGEPRQ